MGQPSAENAVHKQVLVIGHPKSVKFVADVSKMLSSEELLITNEYAVVLDGIRKIAGDGDVPSRLSIRLFASHAENILNEKVIAVVLEVEGGGFNVKYWNVIRQTTCIPQDLLTDAAPADGVQVSKVGDDQKCVTFSLQR